MIVQNPGGAGRVRVLPVAFRGYVLGYVFVRMLREAVLLSFVKRYLQMLTRGYKGISAAASEATEAMSALSGELGLMDQEIDAEFEMIAARESELGDGA